MIDRRYGGPYDRGTADAYYRRPPNPHYFIGNTYMSEEVRAEDMTDMEIREYYLGYEDQLKFGEFKEWE